MHLLRLQQEFLSSCMHAYCMQHFVKLLLHQTYIHIRTAAAAAAAAAAARNLLLLLLLFAAAAATDMNLR